MKSISRVATFFLMAVFLVPPSFAHANGSSSNTIRLKGYSEIIEGKECRVALEMDENGDVQTVTVEGPYFKHVLRNRIAKFLASVTLTTLGAPMILATVRSDYDVKDWAEDTKGAAKWAYQDPSDTREVSKSKGKISLELSGARVDEAHDGYIVSGDNGRLVVIYADDTKNEITMIKIESEKGKDRVTDKSMVCKDLKPY